MRAFVLLPGLFFLVVSARAQSLIVEDARPQPGTAGVSLSRDVAFAFSEEISVSTDWNTAFIPTPRDALTTDRVALCLNLEGSCDGGDDVPRFVRFAVEHEPDTDYTWMVYAVETPDGTPMDTPYVLRYTTASEIGAQQVAGTVQAPAAASSWTPRVRAALRTLARGLGRPFYERDEAPKTSPSPNEDRTHAHVGTVGAKAHSGGHTQVLLLDAFGTDATTWSVRAADVITDASGDYRIDYVRDGTYWPIAVRYTDGTNAEIEALGFHDADRDGAPDPITIDGTNRTGVDVQLYAFPLTTARAASNLAVAVDSAARYAPDQQLKLVLADHGSQPTGRAHAWTYRFYSPSEDLETRVTVDPLTTAVDTTPAAAFLREMRPLPEPFVDSDEALQTVLDDGGQAFIASYRRDHITTVLQGGDLYWMDAPAPSAGFWHVQLIAVTNTGTETFDRYVDMATGALLEPFVYPETLDFDVTRSFGDPSERRSYRLVALPGAEPIPVASTLDGTAGEDWTVYWDDGAEHDYLKKFDGSSTFTFGPGRGFWMLSEEPWTASGTVDTAPLADDGTYAIALHAGWNIIANPFDVDVPWSLVQDLNGVSAALWKWDGSFREAPTFASSLSGEAFYFLNEEGRDVLAIPYPGATAEPASALRVPERTLTLTAFQQDERRAAVRVGIAGAASDGRDPHDQVAPPGYFEGATLHLVNNAIDAELAAEYRPAGRDGYAFDLVLRAKPGESVELQASKWASSDGRAVVFVDPSTGRTYDLQADRTLRLRPKAELTPLKLLVGSEAFVERERATIRPATLQLLPNHPNPFRGRTAFAFSLPEPMAVRLTVYDVLGRRVRTLVDRDVEAGLHPVRWDGRNDAGQSVASGLYLVRLEAGTRTRVRRLVLVR